MAEIDGEVVPVYALAASVHQSPMPNALPDKAALTAAILETAERHLARMLARDA